LELIRQGNENEIINLPFWERVHFGNVCYPKDSPEMANIVKAFIPTREHSLLKMFELKDKLGFEGLDLMYKLLELNPNERISAELAI
jgi:hypothetical protein